MYTTASERGILNNFSKEPAMYYAAPPANAERRRYLIQGALASVLVTGFISMAFLVS
jgi:hypothetical protein